ncbi:hypothetical protein KCU93_g4856, partial [Aureobasidium melanogenum]
MAASTLQSIAPATHPSNSPAYVAMPGAATSSRAPVAINTGGCLAATSMGLTLVVNGVTYPRIENGEGRWYKRGVPTPRIVTEALNVIRRELILDSSYTSATRMTGGQSGVDQFSDTYQFCTYFPDYTLRSKLDCEQIPRNASREEHDVYLESIELNLHAGRVHALGDLVLVSLSYTAPLATGLQTAEQERIQFPVDCEMKLHVYGGKREFNSALRNAYEKGFASLWLIANVALDEKAYYIHPGNKRVCSSESDEAAFLDSVYDQLDILYNIGPGRERISRARPARKDISDAVVAETGLPSVGHTMCDIMKLNNYWSRARNNFQTYLFSLPRLSSSMTFSEEVIQYATWSCKASTARAVKNHRQYDRTKQHQHLIL